MKSITLQPKDYTGTRPYPYHIDREGMVQRQDFWKGQPLRLKGFNPSPVTGVIKGTVHFEKFWLDPNLAIGKYPIFEHQNGEWFTYEIPIEEISYN